MFGFFVHKTCQLELFCFCDFAPYGGELSPWGGPGCHGAHFLGNSEIYLLSLLMNDDEHNGAWDVLKLHDGSHAPVLAVDLDLVGDEQVVGTDDPQSGCLGQPKLGFF